MTRDTGAQEDYRIRQLRSRNSAGGTPSSSQLPAVLWRYRVDDVIGLDGPLGCTRLADVFSDEAAKPPITAERN